MKKVILTGVLVGLVLTVGCNIQKEVKSVPDAISGIYPRLAYYNNEG